MSSNAVPETWQAQNETSRAAWEANAAFWDGRIGDDGNSHFRELLWPALERLLEVQPGQRWLDAACGNGVLSRRLAKLGARVLAFDFSAPLIDLARSRPNPDGGIEYHVADATHREHLQALGPGPFDGLTCSMGLMDMPRIEPLLEAGRELLKPGSPFIFTVVHPCFNTAFASLIAETAPEAGRVTTRYSLRLTDYAGAAPNFGEAIAGQPSSQLYFDRTLESLFGAFFRAGYVLDGLSEPTHSAIPDTDRTPSWRNLAGIPPSLVARMRTRS